jgi:hypothetical protein
MLPFPIFNLLSFVGVFRKQFSELAPIQSEAIFGNIFHLFGELVEVEYLFLRFEGTIRVSGLFVAVGVIILGLIDFGEEGVDGILIFHHK